MPYSDEIKNEIDQQDDRARKRVRKRALKKFKKRQKKAGKAAAKAGKAAAKGIIKGLSKLITFLVSNPVGWIVLFVIIFFILLFVFLSHMPAIVTVPDIHGSSKQTKFTGSKIESVNNATDDSGTVKDAYTSVRGKLNFTYNGGDAMPDDGGDSASTQASGSAAKLLEIEKRELDRWGGKPNGGFYATQMGGSAGMPWCAFFVSWCAKEAGIPDSIIKRGGMARANADAAQADGTWRSSDYTPVPGDLCFITHSGTKTLNAIGHICTVESVDGDTINCIDGNYSHTVARSHRKRDKIVGFRHPNYADTSNSSSNSEEPATDDYTNDDYHTISQNFYDSHHPGWQASAASDDEIIKTMLETRKEDIKNRVSSETVDKYKEKAASGYFVIACFSVSLEDYAKDLFTAFSVKDFLLTTGHRWDNMIRTLLKWSTIDKDVTVTVPALYIQYKKDPVYELDTKKTTNEDANTVYVKCKEERTGRKKIIENWDDTTYTAYKKEKVREAAFSSMIPTSTYVKPAEGESVGYKKSDPARPYFHDKEVYKSDGHKVAKTDTMTVHVHKKYWSPLRKATFFAFFFGYPSQDYEGDSNGSESDDSGLSNDGEVSGSTKEKADKFYNKYKEVILEGWKKYHLYPSVTLAQAQCETTFGTAGAGRSPTNNVYGVSGKDSYGSPYWKPSYGVLSRPEGGTYHQYPNKKDAIGDRNYWLGTMKNYESVRNAKTSTEQAHALVSSKWAVSKYSTFTKIKNAYKNYDKDLPKSDYDPKATPVVGKNESADTAENGTGGDDGIKGLISGTSLDENLRNVGYQNDAVTYNIRRFWEGNSIFAKIARHIIGAYIYPDGDTIQYAPYGKYNKSGTYKNASGTTTYNDVVEDRARVLKQYLKEHGYGGSSTGNTYVWPFDKTKYGNQCLTITSHYGNRSSPGGVGSTNHKGIDISWGGCRGADIRACGSGKVIYAGTADGFGHVVEIQHSDNVVTQYGHVPGSSIKVNTGDSVTQGQDIAQVGSEGHSTGPHLHLGAMHATSTTAVYNNYFDPLELFTKEEHPEGKNPGTVTTSLVGNTNAEKVFNYFVAKGFTKQAAAGIVGNLMQESSCNPNSKQAGGPGRGIAQWSVGERWASMLSWKGSRSEWDLATQLDWLYHEMQTTEKASMGVKDITDVHQATLFFEQKFERAGAPNMSNRYKYADSAYKSWANNT